jgi:hypothetical protein
MICWQLFLFIALQLIPPNLAFAIRQSNRTYGNSIVWFQPAVLDKGQTERGVAKLSVTPKENDNATREVSRETEQFDPDEIAQELLLKRLGIDQAPSTIGFDGDQLPLPVFTSLVIFIGTTALTIYGYYIGIMGFPTDGP